MHRRAALGGTTIAVNHYSTLRIRSDATLDEIDAASRVAIAAVRSSPAGSEMHLDAIREAMATLRNPVRRAVYDESLKTPTPRIRDAPIARDNAKDARRFKLLIGAALLSGLVLGFFIGREHLKYQTQSAMSEALGEFATHMGKAFGGKEKAAEKAPTPAKVVKTYPMTVTLIRKGWEEERYGSKLTMELSFASATEKNARAFDGRLVFTDWLGNQILASKVAINEPVRAGQSIVWIEGIDYNQFIQAQTGFEMPNKTA